MQGAFLAVVGTSSAAMLAFQLSRKLGRQMADKAAAEEMSEEQRQSGILTRVQNAIESGSIQEQVVAVTLLRLTPVIPFRSFHTSDVCSDRITRTVVLCSAGSLLHASMSAQQSLPIPR